MGAIDKVRFCSDVDYVCRYLCNLFVISKLFDTGGRSESRAVRRSTNTPQRQIVRGRDTWHIDAFAVCLRVQVRRSGSFVSDNLSLAKILAGSRCSSLLWPRSLYWARLLLKCSIADVLVRLHASHAVHSTRLPLNRFCQLQVTQPDAQCPLITRCD